jgi:hypothetical protein
VAKGFEGMLDCHRSVSDWIESNSNDRHLHVVAEDLDEEIDWLLGNNFIWRAGYDRFRDYGRYFQAMEERLKRLQSLPQVKDDEKRERIRRRWKPWYATWKNDHAKPQLWEIGWLLMEWRVSEFAPGFPRKVKVSEKRIEQMMADLDISL